MTLSKLKLCIVTGSRAEYGLLWPLMREIKKDHSLQLQVLVTGMHLSSDFGFTYTEIEKDGFVIDEKIDILVSGDNELSTIKSCGLGMAGIAEALIRLAPDWVILLGDRFEIFAAAFAAHQLKIPIAHLHGGEITEGSTDDAMRHAITKMSYLHFTSAKEYGKRVIQLGETPARVFNVGAIGLDNIKKLKLLGKKQLEKVIGMSLSDKTALITYHPATLDSDSALNQINHLLNALDRFPELNLIFTLPNADAGGREIARAIQEFTDRHVGRAKAFMSLGQINYLSLLQFVQVVIGNSSSGIIEVPQFGIPTVNIGDRQKGRIKSSSVIETRVEAKSIQAGIKKAFSPSFKRESRKIRNPYDGGDTAKKIKWILKKTGKINSIKKSFFDLNR